MGVYEDVLTETSTPWAPWRVVPSNNRWFTHVAVGAAVVSALKSLHADYPDIRGEKRKLLDEARTRLESEGE
jgi:hypothetical protein